MDTHQYILRYDLLLQVEATMKQQYDGRGSRATYYNAMRKQKLGERLTLTESLMLQVAEEIVKEKQSELAA